MTCEFNVDRFYAQLGAFSIFVISHERGVKPGSNWISCSVNLMLTDFGPNWTFFFFFFFFLFSVKKSKKRQGMCHLDDTALSSSFFVLLWTDAELPTYTLMLLIYIPTIKFYWTISTVTQCFCSLPAMLSECAMYRKHLRAHIWVHLDHMP